MTIPRIIAIDGPAGSGKSTVGARLADQLGYLFFDTGIMYRVVTYAVLQEHIDLHNEVALSELAHRVQIDVRPPSMADNRTADVLLDGVDITNKIRTKDVEKFVSPVSRIAGVREAMTSQQRRIGQRGNVVMVGRDIGTVVLPSADLKIYLDASLEERARRRFVEIQQRGELGIYAEIYESMRQRDHADTTRKVAPLRPAADAIIVRTDGMSIEEVVELVKHLFNPNLLLLEHS